MCVHITLYALLADLSRGSDAFSQEGRREYSCGHRPTLEFNAAIFDKNLPPGSIGTTPTAHGRIVFVHRLVGVDQLKNLDRLGCPFFVEMDQTMVVAL